MTNWLGKLILVNRIKKLTRNKQIQNFDTAYTIDILFDASDESNFKEIKKFSDFLIGKNKKVSSLGFIDDKAIPSQLYLINNFDFFCKKDLNFFKLPRKESVKEFISRPADIYIDLTFSNNFCYRYISSLKNASFKISRLSENADIFDMMIDISKNNSLPFLIEQISHYIKLLKSKADYRYEEKQV